MVYIHVFYICIMWRLKYWISIIPHSQRNISTYYTSIHTHYINVFFKVAQKNKHNTAANRCLHLSFTDLFLFLPNYIKYHMVLKWSLWTTRERVVIIAPSVASLSLWEPGRNNDACCCGVGPFSSVDYLMFWEIPAHLHLYVF